MLTLCIAMALYKYFIDLAVVQCCRKITIKVAIKGYVIEQFPFAFFWQCVIDRNVIDYPRLKEFKGH